MKTSTLIDPRFVLVTGAADDIVGTAGLTFEPVYAPSVKGGIPQFLETAEDYAENLDVAGMYKGRIVSAKEAEAMREGLFQVKGWAGFLDARGLAQVQEVNQKRVDHIMAKQKEFGGEDKAKKIASDLGQKEARRIMKQETGMRRVLPGGFKAPAAMIRAVSADGVLNDKEVTKQIVAGQGSLKERGASSTKGKRA